MYKPGSMHEIYTYNMVNVKLVATTILCKSIHVTETSIFTLLIFRICVSQPARQLYYKEIYMPAFLQML